MRSRSTRFDQNAPVPGGSLVAVAAGAAGFEIQFPKFRLCGDFFISIDLVVYCMIRS